MEKHLAIILLAGLAGCITPMDLPVQPVDYQLVVDGHITNDPGPYTVRLYRVRPLLQDLDRFVVEKGATIALFDDQGNQEILDEVSNGVYQTTPEGIRGTIGRTYHLEITTSGGNSYYTSNEQIQPVGKIESVRAEYQDGPLVDGEKADLFRIFADARGVEKQTDLLRFRKVGTYQIRTSPKDRKRPVGRDELVPDPIPCSGWIVIDNQMFQEHECTCCDCWVTEKDDIPILFNENYTGLEAFNSLYLGDVKITPTTFRFQYHVEIQQLSLTEESFAFWNQVRIQKTGISDLFQPAIASLTGNVHPVGNASPALGYFWAAGIDKASIFLTRQDVPRVVPGPYVYIADCTELQHTTNQKPSFWP